jgi:hypothetical protein
VELSQVLDVAVQGALDALLWSCSEDDGEVDGCREDEDDEEAITERIVGFSCRKVPCRLNELRTEAAVGCI